MASELRQNKLRNALLWRWDAQSATRKEMATCGFVNVNLHAGIFRIDFPNQTRTMQKMPQHTTKYFQNTQTIP